MAGRWRNPRWWQTLAAALAIGMLIGGAYLWATDGADVRPEVTAERPPASVRITYLPEREGSETARISCSDEQRPRATGVWADDPQAACRALYAAAAVVLDAPPSADEDCVPRRYEPRPFTVTGEIGGESVDRRFTRQDRCAHEAWQAARVLIDPWLELESPELEAAAQAG